MTPEKNVQNKIVSYLKKLEKEGKPVMTLLRRESLSYVYVDTFFFSIANSLFSFSTYLLIYQIHLLCLLYVYVSPPQT